MAKAIKKFFITFFTYWVEDFLILSGIILGIVNTYLITVIKSNILAGNYLLSVVLIFMGIILARR